MKLKRKRKHNAGVQDQQIGKDINSKNQSKSPHEDHDEDESEEDEDDDEEEDSDDDDEGTTDEEDDDEENEDDEDEDESEKVEKTAFAVTNGNKRLRSRFAMCSNCEEEFDVTLNSKTACRWHDGMNRCLKDRVSWLEFYS